MKLSTIIFCTTVIFLAGAAPGFAAADRILLTGASAVTTGDCTLYTVQSADFADTPTAVVAASLVDLAGAGSNGAFYAAADTTCTGSAITEVTIPAAQATVQFRYLKGDTVGSPVTLTATDRAADGDDLSADNGSLAVTVSVPVADNLALTGPAAIVQGRCSLPYTVHAEDSANVDTPVVSASLVDLAGAGSNGAFYAVADTTCTGSTLTEVTIPAAQATVQFRYLKGDTVGSPVTLTATDRAADGDDLSADNGSLAVTVSVPVADNLSLTGLAAIVQGRCELYTVHAEDSTDTATPVVSASLVDLAGAGSSGAFYAAADTTCTGSTLTEVTIPAAQATAEFRYLKGDTVGSPVTLTATDRAADGDDLSADNGSLAVTVSVPVADNLSLTGLAAIVQGRCELYTVHAEDSTDTATPVVSASLVDLAGAGSNGAFYATADTTCTGSTLTEVTIPAAQTVATFRYRKDDTVGSPVTLTATDRAADGDDLSADNGSLAVTVSVPVADNLALTGPAAIVQGRCSLPYTVHAEDSMNIDTPVVSASLVDLAGAGSNGAFYAVADTTCTGSAITEVTIPAAQATVQFRYLKGDTVGSPVTLTATDRAADGDDLSADNGSLAVTVSVPVADNLSLTGLAAIVQGRCELYTVHAEDSTDTGTPVVSASLVDLAGAGSNGAFYAAADTTCSGSAITEVTIPAAQTVATFRYRKDDTIGSPVTLTATDRPADGDDLSAEDGSLAVTVTVPVADNLALTGPAAIVQGRCSLPYTVHAEDSMSLDTPVVSASLVDLAGAGSNGAFYAVADTTCSGSAITEVTIPAAQATVQFRYLKGDTVGSPVTLTATDRPADGDDLSAEDGSLAVTVSVPVADNLALTGPGSILQSSCAVYTVHAEDSMSLDTPVVAASLVDLGGAGSSGAFYALADTTCTGSAITEVTIPAAQATVQFRYRKDDIAGSPVTLTAIDRPADGDDLSAEDGTRVVTVVGLPADRLQLSGPALVTAGDCNLYTVEPVNFSATVMPVVAASIVDLSHAGSNGAFYAAGDTACTGSTLTDVTIPATQSSVQFHYRKADTLGSPVTLTATDRAADGDDLSAANGTLGVTVAASPVDRLLLFGSTAVNAGACTLYTVQSADSGSTPTPVVATSLVDLSGAGSSGAFYTAADTTCTGSAITDVTIAAAQSAAAFHYRKDDTVGSPVTLTATDRAADGDDLSAANGSVVVTVTAAVADRVLLSGPTGVTAGDCNLYTLEATSFGGSPTAVVAASVVDLSRAGSNGAFYTAADTTCTGGTVSDVTIPAAQSSVQFHYRKGDAVGSPVTLTAIDRAADGDDLSAANGSLGVTVAAAPADRLLLFGSTAVNAGTCTLYTVQSADFSDTPTPVVAASLVDLAGAGSNGAFYDAADTTCTGGAVTDVTIAAAQSVVAVRYRKDDTVGSPVTLTATDRAADGDDLSVADGSVVVTVDAALADRLLLSGLGAVNAGACTVYTVQSADFSNTPLAVGAASLVDLAGAGSNGAFYDAADTTCTGGAVTDVTIDAAQSSATFRYRKDDTAGSPVTLTATDRAADGDDLSAANGSLEVTVDEALADRLLLFGPEVMDATDCGLYTVESTDFDFATTPVVAASLVDLGGAGSGGAFYDAADTTCTGSAITEVTIPAAQSSADFRYRKDNTGGSPVTLTATDRTADGDDLSADDGIITVTITAATVPALPPAGMLLLVGLLLTGPRLLRLRNRSGA